MMRKQSKKYHRPKKLTDITMNEQPYQGVDRKQSDLKKLAVTADGGTRKGLRNPDASIEGVNFAMNLHSKTTSSFSQLVQGGVKTGTNPI